MFKNILTIALALATTNLYAFGIDQDNQQAQQAVSKTYNHIDTSERVTNHASDGSNAMGYTPSVNGTIGMNVCSKHGGASAGWGGFNFGILLPFSDDDCNRRQDAVYMKELNSIATGREVMCEDIRVLRSSVRAGRPCWLEDSDLLDELTTSERAYYFQIKGQQAEFIRQEEERKRKVSMQ